MNKVLTQFEFLKNVAQLIYFADQQGIVLTGGELFRTTEQQQIYVDTGKSTTMKSKHLERLAIDFNFFIKGELTYKKKDIQVLGNLLKSSNYRIAIAVTGQQALDYVKKTAPDLILLDIMMPELDGIEVCRRLKKADSTSEIPILFITALTDSENKINAFDAGGDDYITKPFSRQEVLARVKVFLERKQAKANLLESREQLKEMNLNLERTVTKRTERIRKMQSQMVLQDKMASIGQLAAGIAHELNNPINFVYTNFITLKDNVSDLKSILVDYRHALKQIPFSEENQLTLDHLQAKEKDMRLSYVLEDLEDLFSESSNGFERIIYIIDSIRDFSREGHSEDFSSFDMNKGIEDTLVIARNEYKNSCNVKTDFGDIQPVLCIPQLINEELLNIVVNASQAIKALQRKELGNITIRTFTEDHRTCCDIEDDGPGIPESIQAKIFEPFFTTKEVGKGTGLGLSISYDIMVKKHHGNLEILQSGPTGTTFRIGLPFFPKT